MNERRLMQLLRDAPVPDEREAQDRGWRVVRAALEARHPAPVTRGLNRLAIAVGVALLIVAVALSPAGAKVADLVHDVVQPGEENAQPALTSLPAPGRLLVTSAKGPWVVDQDGSKRLLGAYEHAAWSPHGLFVAVTRGRALTAVDPTGTVRWSLAARRPVSNPAWSTSGIRVAYESGSSLRVVAGDGTDDHLLAGHVAPVAPAWKPLRKPLPAGQVATGPGTNVLAYADRRGRVIVRDVDSGRLLLRSPPGPAPTELLWSSDGGQLVAVTPDVVRTFEPNRGHAVTASTPRRWTIRAAAFKPGSHKLALLETTRGSPQGTRGAVGSPTGPDQGKSAAVVGHTTAGSLPARRLFAGPGRFQDLAWSPDGRWLLLGWRDPDQWLFLRPSDGRVRAVGHISRQFDPGATGKAPFPGIGGWCCGR